MAGFALCSVVYNDRVEQLHRGQLFEVHRFVLIIFRCASKILERDTGSSAYMLSNYIAAMVTLY